MIAPALAAGVITGRGLHPSNALALLAGFAGVVAAAAAWIWLRSRHEPHGEGPLPAMGLGATALLAAGVLLIGVCDGAVRGAEPKVALGTRSSVHLTGMVGTDPDFAHNALRFELGSAKTSDGRAAGRVLVTVYGKAPALRFGDRVELWGNAGSSAPASGPLKVTASAGRVEVISRSRNPVLRAANFLRDRMEGASRRALGRSDGSLAMGIVIGDRRGIDPAVQQDFITAGLSHITAVSGANLAMVMAAVVFVLALFRTGRRARIALSLAVIGFFAVLARMEPSVMRAAVMAALALTAFFFGRSAHPLNSLAVAFVVLAGATPSILWSVGFQLSALATAGIVVLAPRILGRLGRLPRPVAEALAVSIGAQAAVLPLIAFRFGRVSMAAVPANLAAFPMVAPATVLALLGGLTAIVFPPIGEALLRAAGFFVVALRASAHWFASLPLASLQVSKGSWKWMVVAYLILAAAALALTRHRRPARLAAMGAVAVLSLASFVPPAGSALPGGLRLTFFDVGQGDAALVESPAGARVVIDGGRDPNLVAGLLASRRLDRIDLVVFSHGHADHVTGLQAVLSKFPVREAIEPGVPNGLISRVRSKTPLEKPGEGDHLTIGDLDIEILSPDPDEREAAVAEAAGAPAPAGAAGPRGPAEGSALNDASLVLRIGWGDSCALFTGDIQEDAQQTLIERHRDRISCAVLKAPHHGSARITGDFVSAVGPRFVVVSVGPNDYGHPTLKALDLFAQAGAKTLRTDRMGTVELDSGASGFTVKR